MTLSPELARWRKAERAALIARRVAASAAEHAQWSAAIDALLEDAFPMLAELTVGICWPFQAEFDARPFATRLIAKGARVALPMVVAKAQPLEFREWFPGCAMTTGVYDLPVPEGTRRWVPDALLIPVVGIGRAGDRLGYGGGFFDRTIASFDPKPLSIALAFELSRIESSDPQPHDIPMDFVVTEAGVQVVRAGALDSIDVVHCRTLAASLLHARGLPRPTL
jgi:5,10-methenyltetrahydrofolate synthetase